MDEPPWLGGVHFGFNCIGQEVLGQMGLNLMRVTWEHCLEPARHHPLSLGLGRPSASEVLFRFSSPCWSSELPATGKRVLGQASKNLVGISGRVGCGL